MDEFSRHIHGRRGAGHPCHCCVETSNKRQRSRMARTRLRANDQQLFTESEAPMLYLTRHHELFDVAIACSPSFDDLRDAARADMAAMGHTTEMRWTNQSFIEGSIYATEPLYLDHGRDDDSHYVVTEEPVEYADGDYTLL